MQTGTRSRLLTLQRLHPLLNLWQLGPVDTAIDSTIGPVTLHNVNVMIVVG